VIVESLDEFIGLVGEPEAETSQQKLATLGILDTYFQPPAELNDVYFDRVVRATRAFLGLGALDVASTKKKAI